MRRSPRRRPRCPTARWCRIISATCASNSSVSPMPPRHGSARWPATANPSIARACSRRSRTQKHGWKAGNARMAACRRLVAPIAACAIAAATACAPKRVELPSGATTPLADAAAAYDQAVQECRGTRTIQATLGLSGRAGTMKLRGSVDAGFEAPEKVRLEGRHPLGRPVFILVAAPEATLFLPRENRVLRNVGAAEIVEALVGLPLGGGELRSLVSGCGFAVAEPSQGRSYAAGWVAVDTGESTTYLRQVDGRWRVAAASRPPLVVHYSGFVLGRPTVLRL